MPNRPPFIVSSSDVPEKVHCYPNSDERMAPARPIGRAAGMLQIGVHLVRVPPGTRTSYPHAESAEEEFVYVIEGEIDAWIDGEVHRMKAGDFAAFPVRNRDLSHLHQRRRSRRFALVRRRGKQVQQPHPLPAQSRASERHAVERLVERRAAAHPGYARRKAAPEVTRW